MPVAKTARAVPKGHFKRDLLRLAGRDVPEEEQPSHTDLEVEKELEKLPRHAAINILAIDAATRLGWASEVAGFRASGVVSFALHAGDTPGWRFVRFNAWLYEWKGLDAIAMERPLPIHKQRATAEIAFGFSTRIEEYCARRNVRLFAVHNSTLKKFATGNGRAEKFAMVRLAQALKPGVADDNEADALWLLEYCKKVALPQR